MPVVYRCANRKRFHDDGIPYCTYEAPAKWLGRCPECYLPGNPERSGFDDAASAAAQKDFSLASAATFTPRPRVATNLEPFDALTGGGIPEGATVLISGESGIGKTTLLLKLCDGAATGRHKAFFITSEEQQIGLLEKAQRLGVANPNVIARGIAEDSGDIYKMAKVADEIRPSFMVIDSIQESFVSDLPYRIGSAEQQVGVLKFLRKFCEKRGIACMIISHVNKSGEIKGSTAIEHLTEAVLEFDSREVLDADHETIEETKGWRRLTLAVKTRIAPRGSRLFKMTVEGQFTDLTEADLDRYSNVKEKRKAAEKAALEAAKKEKPRQPEKPPRPKRKISELFLVPKNDD